MRRPSKKFIALQPAVTCECFCFVFVLVSSRSGSDQGGASISTFLNPNIPTRSSRLSMCECVGVRVLSTELSKSIVFVSF